MRQREVKLPVKLVFVFVSQLLQRLVLTLTHRAVAT